MKRAILLIAILLLPTVLAESFPTQNPNYGFVGWQIESGEKIGEYRLSYPAIGDGEEVNMAQNGPFAVVVFYADESEDTDQYIWLQDELALWGYISLVVEDEVSWESVDYQLTGWNNGSYPSVLGAQNMFALDYISLGGHGTGAHFAAEIVKSGNYEIDGLFGLGLDGASSEHSQSIVLSRPSSALFLTGTTDDIAPANENVMSYLNTWPGAWQVMHARGANHIGYQETDGFFERLADGDSTMGRDGQQKHAIDHILPYLNLSLKGDDSAYQTAFNREDKSVSVDSDAYIDEDLTRSRLYHMEDITSDLMSVMLNQSFTVSANVTMRDGSPASGNVSCYLPDGDVVNGVLQNNVASCQISGSALLPGPSLIELHVHDNSFSDWLELFINRIGMPMEITNPIPTIYLDQHSSVTVSADVFASDPDGENIVFTSAEILQSENRLSLTSTGSELNISHIADQEWDGSVLINLTISTSDESVNLTTNVTVLPVNDPVVQTGTIPQQISLEDGASIVVDFADYVSDPEGEPLVVSATRDYPGIRIEATQSSVLIDPQTHWNGAEFVEFTVSDGVTDSLQIFVPINIEPVDDMIEFSSDSFSVEFDEDETLSIDLDNFTINVDNDVLSYTITGQSDILGYSLAGSDLLFAGNPNQFGTTTFTIEVSDGSNSTSAVFNVKVNSVPDLPTVAISSVDVDGNLVSILWTISDNDGKTGLVYSVKFDNKSIEQGTECTGSVLLTCLSTTKATLDGVYTAEVKVWDNNAQQWSNNDTLEIEVVPKVETKDDSESDIEIGDWVLPIGLGLVVLLLIGYMFQSRKN